MISNLNSTIIGSCSTRLESDEGRDDDDDDDDEASLIFDLDEAVNVLALGMGLWRKGSRREGGVGTGDITCR